MKLQVWANKGGDVEHLWESVKDAKHWEGVVVRDPGRTLPKKILAELSNLTPPLLMGNIDEPASDMQMNIDKRDSIVAPENGISAMLNPMSKQKIDSLEAQLCKVVSEREHRKTGMEVVGVAAAASFACNRTRRSRRGVRLGSEPGMRHFKCCW